MPFGFRGIEESMHQEVLREREAQAEGHALALAQGCPQELAGRFAMAYAEGVKRGRLKEAREILIRLGTMEFGTPDEETEAWIMSLNNLDRMHEFVDRILDPVGFFLNWREFHLGLSRDLKLSTQDPPALETGQSRPTRHLRQIPPVKQLSRWHPGAPL